MIVTCEKCDTHFNLDEKLLKITGSKVRCSKCKHVFVAYPPKPFEDEAMMESGDMEAAMERDVDADTALDSDFQEEQATDETVSEADVPDDLDLSDIEKMLEIEETAETDVTVKGSLTADEKDEDAGDSLDISDIEKILEEEDIGDELTGDKTDEDRDLVFDLDEALEMEAGEDQLSSTSELDLGDLEKMFESEAEEPDFSLEEEPELSHDLDAGDARQNLLSMEEDEEAEDLDLNLEDESSSPEPEKIEETLDFDLEDMEEDIEEEEMPRLSPEEEIQELHFDLEDMAEDSLEAKDSEEADAETSDSGSNMDLQLELEEEDESNLPEIEEPVLSMKDEASEASDRGGALEEETVDDFLSAIAEVEGEEIGEEDMEIEPGETQEKSFGGPGDEASYEEPSDLDEETEIDFPDDAVPNIPDEEDDLLEEEPIQEEDLEETRDVSEEILMSKPAEEKSILKKVIAGLLVAVLVILVVLAALVFLQQKGYVNVPYLDQVELPFLGKVTAPETPDSGNLNIVVTSEVDSRFLDGGKAGKLFLVTGKVKNGYDHPRSHIQVSGSLYTRGAVLAQTVKAYCGNVLPDLELLKMTLPEIQMRMENRSGESNSNVGVQPGAELPFMIVFSDFPENLEEFTVSVAGSSADGK